MIKKLISVSEAQERILYSQRALAPEKIPLRRAIRRISAGPVLADSDRPAFTRSSMDGYVVSNKQSRAYLIQGEIPAGIKKPVKLPSGHCLRVYTGSALPSNSLAVIPQELTERVGQKIKITTWPQVTFIRQQGEDAKSGDLLLGSGTDLRAPELAILAQEGQVQLLVHQRVLISHLAMGKELVSPSRQPLSGQIRDSNSSLISGLLQSPAYQLILQKRIADNPEAALRVLKSPDAQQSHMLLISGGAGPGDHDWGRHLIRQLGFSTLVDGIDLRPGKPLIVARKRKQTLFILPGNPVSHWVTWQLFVQPLLRRLSGWKAPSAIVKASLESDWKHNSDPRSVWWPAQFSYRSGLPRVAPLPLKSSGDATHLKGANSLIHFTRAKENFKSGDEVDVLIDEI
jgi:molybdopterin molybdotransferase